jgi:hypothetical protein
MAKPKVKSKKMGPTDPVEEEEKAKAKVEAEPRPEKEEENLGKASPKDISNTHLLPFPHQAKKSVEDEKFSRFGSNPDNVCPHSYARRHANPNLCNIFEGYPEPDVTNTQNGQARVCRKMQRCYP